MALKTMIANLNKAREAYEAKLKTLGKSAQKSVVEELAPLVPDGFALRWTQYTPYFNDGDPCVFSVNDPEVCAVVDDEVSSDKRADLTSFGIKSYGSESWSPRLDGLTKAALTELRRAWEEIPHDLLEKAFGDHREVVIHGNAEYSVEDYDHD